MSAGDSAPCVSVIIPAFNASATIVAAIESALGQTLSDLEVIVIDDGSVDDTGALLASIHDSRVRLLCQDHGGVARARNRGLEVARGKFITFLDADDMWTADKLALQVEALLSDPAAGAVYSWTAFFDQSGRYLFAKEPGYHSGDVYAELLVTFFLASGSNVLARRECIESMGPFDQSAEPVEDWEYWLRVAKTWRFALAPRYQILYRFTAASASAAVERYQRAVERVAANEFVAAPPALRERQRECLSNLKQHGCLLYLARTTAPDAHGRAGWLLWASITHHPAVLSSGRTFALLGAWLALCLLPRRKVTGVVHGLLRCYGRWMQRTVPELRTLVPARLAQRA